MLQMYTEAGSGVEVSEDSVVVFDNKTVQTGCTVTANAPSNTITLNKSGFYRIDFNALVSIDGADSKLIGVIMERNGVEVNEAQTGALPASTSVITPMSFSTLIRVRPSCESVDNTARLQFKVTGANVLFYFANVVVTKIA